MNELKGKDIIVDSWSLTPLGCVSILLRLLKSGTKASFTSEDAKNQWIKKIDCIMNGKEFLPEYYSFAKQFNLSLDVFRNCDIIQKDFGFRDQRGDKTIDYIKKDNEWIKDV